MRRPGQQLRRLIQLTVSLQFQPQRTLGRRARRPRCAGRTRRKRRSAVVRVIRSAAHAPAASRLCAAGGRMASRLTTLIVVVIVAGTLIAGLIVGAQRDDASGPADLIVTNGRVYTGSADRFAEALAVRGNKILRVGTNRDIKRLRRPQTLMIDAHGAAVLPGFNDAHVHLLDGGLALARLDLSSADTFEGLQTRIRD